MTLEDFKDDVLKRFTRELADQLFLYIERDRDLMHEYLAILGKENGTDETNQVLVLALKKYFGLNEEGENHSPKSVILSSYTRFINPVEEGLPPNPRSLA